jgi:hypothetical protein
LDGLWLRKYSLLNNQLCLLEIIELKPSMILGNDWKVNKAEFISQTVIYRNYLLIINLFFRKK